jgi:hypothetical protein
VRQKIHLFGNDERQCGGQSWCRLVDPTHASPPRTPRRDARHLAVNPCVVGLAILQSPPVQGETGAAGASLPCQSCSAATKAAAIGLVEIGRINPTTGTLQFWPWIINVAGQGYYLNFAADAISAVQDWRGRPGTLLANKRLDKGCCCLPSLRYMSRRFSRRGIMSGSRVRDPGAS